MKKLNALIDNYGIKKEELDLLKKDTDKLNTEIKQLMKENELTDYSTKNYKAIYEIRKSESLDEDQVIEILKANGVKNVVKTKEYVDEDALEQAIYNGKLDQNVLKAINECRIVKETVALKIKGV